MNELESVFVFGLAVVCSTRRRLMYPAVVIARYNCHDDDACFSPDNDRARISFPIFPQAKRESQFDFRYYSLFIVHSCENENSDLHTVKKTCENHTIYL